MFTNIQPFKPYIWVQKWPVKPSGASTRPKTEEIIVWYALYIPPGKYNTVKIPTSSDYKMIYDGKVREFKVAVSGQNSGAPEHWIEDHLHIPVLGNTMLDPMIENRVKITVDTDGGPGEGGSSVGNYEDSDDD